jgi:hypothetical protein
VAIEGLRDQIDRARRIRSKAARRRAALKAQSA